MNIHKLRNSLIETYQKLKKGEIGLKEAKEESNVARTIISSAKVQMEYNNYIQSKNKIEFLNSDK